MLLTTVQNEKGFMVKRLTIEQESEHLEDVMGELRDRTGVGIGAGNPQPLRVIEPFGG